MRLSRIVSILLIIQQTDPGDAASESITHKSERSFISPDLNSELITLPRRSHNSKVPTRSRNLQGDVNCPHLENGLSEYDDPSTWTSAGMSFPAEGQDVILPPNTKVVIRGTVPFTLGLLTIPEGSELIIGEQADSELIALDVNGIDVKGVLRVGSETCRLENQPIEITLHGSRSVDAVTNPKPLTYKGIVVSGSNALLELHGGEYEPTWTRLASTAEIGDSRVYVQDVVNWDVGGNGAGMEIVITTTAMKDSREWHQNEVFEIVGVELGNHGGSVITIDGTIEYSHTANSGYQAEVGLLTRTLKIQGSSLDSEPTDPDPLTCTSTVRLQGAYGGTHCPNTELTGYGGHVRIQDGATAHVEGVELYRMGQTNVLGRYPMHFHLLGDSCPTCYFRDSSIHRSFYRCVSIHGTNQIVVADNVGHDIVGYCYYLEDGIEEQNEIIGNLASHVHWMGPQVWNSGQTIPTVSQSDTLTLPADVTASGFYITNVHNKVVGNAASGGWAGFAFPVLHSPIGPSQSVNMRPSSRTVLEFRGNTAHSSGWWWYHAGAFYLGGSLYYQGDKLVYNAGRDQNMGSRSPCYKDWCAAGNCNGYCQPTDQAWNLLEQNKAFLTPGPGMNSWSGRAEIVGYETHDVGLALEALESGFWISDLLAVCRSGTPLVFPSGSDATDIAGDGFFWYDTNQEHILTHGTFRNCGYRGNYDQYNSEADRGCGDDAETGCRTSSTVFGFLTHSDQFTPEVMQASKDVTYDNCGRRFQLHDFRNNNNPSTVSGRGQNWFDVDGSAAGIWEGTPTIIGSGLADAGLWWLVDDEVFQDTHGPLTFIKQTTGPERGIAHIKIYWDDSIHNQVGGSVCGNGNNRPCPSLGTVQHFGPRFQNSAGLPVTANADIVGPVGGFGWMLTLNDGAPKNLKIDSVEVDPDTPLLLGIQYPPGTGVNIVANAAYCQPSSSYSCQETFHRVDSMLEVRESLGNSYYLSAEGLMVTRIIMSPQTFTGAPEWIKPTYETLGKWNSGYALNRFERDGIILPKFPYGPWIDIVADCAGNVYCSQTTAADEADASSTTSILANGFCNWGPNGDGESSVCQGGAQGGEWCNANQSQCEGGCGGRWCTDGVSNPTLAPVSAPVGGPPTPPPPGTFVEVCPNETYEQVAYDKCCSTDEEICAFADGSTTNNNEGTEPPTFEPTYEPTNVPSSSPTNKPTNTPTSAPSSSPTNEPTGAVSDAEIFIKKMTIKRKLVNNGNKNQYKFTLIIKDENAELIQGAFFELNYTYGNKSKFKGKSSNKKGVANVKIKVPSSEVATVSLADVKAPEGYTYNENRNHKYADDCPAFTEDCLYYEMEI